jgi:hypothetical protein
MFAYAVCNWICLKSKPYEIWPPPPDVTLSPPYEVMLGCPS